MFAPYRTNTGRTGLCRMIDTPAARVIERQAALELAWAMALAERSQAHDACT